MANIAEKTLETVAAATQSFEPLKAVCACLSGFHNYSDNLTRIVEAHHYCAHPTPDLRQCLIYDSRDKDARLIGVEYMIPIERFKALPAEEKQYWHSHFFEVKGGLLTMPKPTGVPSSVWESSETRELAELANWVGKTYHFWQVDRGDKLPLGPPQLMTSVTNDDQIGLATLKERDERDGVDTAHKRKIREDIKVVVAPEGLDAAAAVKNGV